MNIEWISTWRAGLLVRSSRYQAQLADLPQGLESYWRESAPLEYERIRVDALFFARAAEGLMSFFDAVRLSGNACALPSAAADSVWHAWLRYQAVGLERFCVTHFGRTIPHVEREGLGFDALRSTLSACRNLNPTASRRYRRLPPLFRLDARLRMPSGYGYWLRRRDILHAMLDDQGHGIDRARRHPELTPGALYISELARRDVQSGSRSRQMTDTSSCGTLGSTFVSEDAGGRADDSDGCGDVGGSDGGSDSCSDGGSSCGSGCGGGGGGD